MTPTAKGTRTITSSALAWVTLMAPWRGPGRTCGLWATPSAAGRCHDRSDGPRPENGRHVPPLRDTDPDARDRKGSGAEAGQVAGDDRLHDLRGAAVNRLHPRVGVGPGDRVLGHVPVAAEQLQAP